MKNATLLLAAILFLLSFTLRKTGDLKDKLPGVWIEAGWDNNTSIYTRQKALADKEGGMQLLPGGKLVVRQNSGWCGTPPISYTNYNGSWGLSNDTLQLDYKYWGGNMRRTVKVTGCSNDTLRLQEIKTVSDRLSR